MSDARRDPSEVGRDVATSLMLRQLFLVASNLMQTGNDGLLAWRDDLKMRLDQAEAGIVDTDAVMHEMRQSALRAIDDVFEPIIE